MILQDVMTTEPITVESEDFVIDAVKVFRDNRINGAPVMKEKKFVGLLTNEQVLDFMEIHEFGKELLFPAPFDFIEAIIDMKAEIDEVEREFQRIKKSKIGDIMKKDPITASPSMHVSEAADLMTENGLTHLPIIESEKLVGLVTRSDLVKSLIQ